MNYLGKELVRSFDWSDVKKNREIEKRVKLNGRIYYKTGTYTATSIVGDLYRIYDQSNKQFNYVLMVGVARQHPTELVVSRETGIEIAALNAKNNPDMILKLNHRVDWNFFRNFCENYVYTYLKKQLVKTPEEINKNITE